MAIMSRAYLISWQWIRIVALALVLLGAVGCGGAKTYPVRGKVVFKDGKALTGGTVIFEPVDKNLKVSARGDIQPDGTFRLGTDSDNDGAPEGGYHVLVVPPPPEENERRPQRSPIPRKYLSPETSPLKLTVTRDKDKNNFTIELDRP
jgi:hypothetical protein